MTVFLKTFTKLSRRLIVSLLLSTLIGLLLLSVGARRGSSHSPASKSRAGETSTEAKSSLLNLPVPDNPVAVTNSPPVAVDDSYTVHGSLQVNASIAPYGLLHNDSDPDGDNIYCQERSVTTAHGSGYIYYNGSITYYPNYGFVGTDSTTYTIGDGNGGYSTATITFNVVNQPPTVVNDSYYVHGSLQTYVNQSPYGVLHNDSDPDGDGFHCQEKNDVATAHGRASLTYNGNVTYYPNSGFAGTDNLSYTVCDDLGACSDGTMTFNVDNHPPVAVADLYVVRYADLVRGYGNYDTYYNTPQNGALNNDYDPDGNNFYSQEKWDVATAHGHVSIWYNGRVQYSPDPGYVGADSTTYTICDDFNACTTGTIWFFVLDNEDDGAASCNAHIGGPVNVTNGNMYLQQADYKLPGVGGDLEVVRTYNSNSQSTGLFGKGWTTAYDENITLYGSNLLRLTLADGRAVYFGRSNTSNPYALLSPGFYGQIAPNANGYTVSFKDGSVHQFSAAGKLVSMADRNGNQTTLTYDANGKLTQVTDPFGRVLSVTTDTNGHITSLSDTLGSIATYAYSANGELQTVTYPDSSGFNFTYTASGSRSLLTTVTDALGHVVESHAYDWAGRATTSERDSGVEHYSLNYIASNETDVTDALSHVTKYYFDNSKGRNVVTRIDGVCSCGGGTLSQTWTYDNQLNVLTKTNALNQTTTFTYDTSGDPLTVTNALGTATLTYNSFGEVLTATDPMQGVVTNTYDTHGNLLTTKDALNHTTTFTYDTRGQLLTAKDALNNVSTLTWNTSGQLAQVQDAANHTSAYGYDARGRVTTITNALNEATAYEYDAAGRPKKITYPDASYIQYTYDLGGRRTKVRDARGLETNFAYDAANRLTSATNADSKTTSYAYDLMSHPTSVTDALNRTTSYEYDTFNRLDKITHPPATSGATALTEQIGYDAGGRVTSRTDEAGRVTSYDYDSANRLIKVTDPAAQATQYEYNALTEMTAVVDALSQRYEFAYDAVGHVTQVTRGGGSMSYAYDAVGNRTSRTDYNNATTNYSYDTLNRLTTTTYPDTTTTSYAYDALSRLNSATNANGTVGYSYDNRGRVSSTTDVFNQTVGYGYDANNNRTSLSLGQTTSATYQYDVLNRLTQLSDGNSAATTYSYDATNRLTSRTLPNGVVSSYSYDDLDRLTRLQQVKGTTTVADAQYQYNSASDITQIVEPTQTRNFTYDSIDRLTAVTNPTQTVESYTYDGVGNRTASHISSTYSYQSFNKVVTIGSNSYSYDANGNLTSKTDSSGTWSYSWDYENRLKQVTRPDSTTITYKYDALGRRIQRSKSGGLSTNFVYDGADVIKDINSDNSTVEYLNGLGIDDKLRQTSSAGTVYFTQDHLGSTRALTDSSGSVVENVNYDSFGNGVSSLTRYGYTGREWDGDANLYYYRNRWYDPQAGRFISEDPIGLRGGINPYAYVGNSPTGFIDPKGTQRAEANGFTQAELDQAQGMRRQMASWQQPKYADNYDWWETFWAEFNQRNAACIREIFYLPSEILSKPDVQFVLMSLGMPYGTPFGGIGAGAGAVDAGEAGAAEVGGAKAVEGPTIKVGDLDPLHSPETSGARPELEKLSDSDLLDSVKNPRNGDPLKISTETGKVVDGNGRAYELLRRAINPNSSITHGTRIPYEPYTPNNSAFPQW
jgi:RHS repeat-associated protein